MGITCQCVTIGEMCGCIATEDMEHLILPAIVTDSGLAGAVVISAIARELIKDPKKSIKERRTIHN